MRRKPAAKKVPDCQKQKQIREQIAANWKRLLGDINIFIRKHGLYVKGMAPAQLAEEALQETVAEALHSAPSYDPDRPAMAWIRTISVRCLQRICGRESQRRKRLSLVSDVCLNESEEQERSEDESFDRIFSIYNRCDHSVAEGRYLLRELFAHLNEEEQMLLKYAYIQGMTAHEVAAEMGLSEGTVWTRLSRLRERLRPLYLSQPACI